MISLHLLVADLRHVELRVLGRKFVVRQYHVRAYPKPQRCFLVTSYVLRSRIPPTVAIITMTR